MKTYRQASALELVDIPCAADDHDAPGLADLYPQSHDTAANGVLLAIRLLNYHNGAGRREIGPVGIIRNVGGG